REPPESPVAHGSPPPQPPPPGVPPAAIPAPASATAPGRDRRAHKEEESDAIHPIPRCQKSCTEHDQPPPKRIMDQYARNDLAAIAPPILASPLPPCLLYSLIKDRDSVLVAMHLDLQWAWESRYSCLCKATGMPPTILLFDTFFKSPHAAYGRRLRTARFGILRKTGAEGHMRGKNLEGRITRLQELIM